MSEWEMQFSASVLRIEQRERIVAGRKAKDGGATFSKEGLGWWIEFDGNISVYVGETAPNLKVGDIIGIAMQKVSFGQKAAASG